MTPARRAGVALPAATALAAMIATPLARRGGAARRRLAHAVIGGLATAAVPITSARWGAGRAAAATAGVIASTWTAERIGSHTGVPFGRYRYTAVLRPQLGGVPAIVPCAWLAMSIPAREVAAALVPASTAARVATGALALTAWDLFLDPQMVGEGYWRWHRRGRYRGIPASNFAGWLLTAAGVMALLERALPPAGRHEQALVGVYAAMALMETVGFAVFFRDRLVAVAGGAAMLPLAAAALARQRRR